MFDKAEYPSIGTAKFKDFPDFCRWFKSEEGKNYMDDNWSKECNQEHRNNWAEKKPIGFYKLQKYIPYLSYSLQLYRDRSMLTELAELQEFLDSTDQPFELLYRCAYFAIICKSSKCFLIPTAFLTITPYKNYNDISPKEIRLIKGAEDVQGLIPADMDSTSLNSINEQKRSKNNQLKELEKQIADLEDEKRAELEEIKRQLEEKYRDKMELLNRKQQELKSEQKKLKNKMFLLETEIYGIRCYLGEVCKFIKLCSGTRAEEKTPIVVYQKIRYLDEELGKYLSIYEFDGEDIKYFEQAFVAREDLREMLVPGKKSVVFLRVSASGIQYGEHPFAANLLKKYKLTHGGMLGILLRDGENFWIGWLDENAINIKTGDAFYRPKQEIITEQDKSKIHVDSREEIASRFFIFNILQGITDRGDLLRIPDKVSFGKPSPYLVLSYADGWLEDNRFGSFADIVKMTHEQPIAKNDMILTTMRITRDDMCCNYNRANTVYAAWNNDRGRGDKNRTHDAQLSNCTLYPVSCIDTKIFYRIIYKKYKCDIEEIVDSEGTEPNEARISHYETTRTDEFLGTECSTMVIENGFYRNHNVKKFSEQELYQLYIRENAVRSENNVITFVGNKPIAYWLSPEGIEFENKETSIFVSAEKNGWYEGRQPHANLQICEGEYLNLTYLNTVWVQYAIQNKKIGGWEIAGTRVDYAKSIAYLNKALDYLKVREEQESLMLAEHFTLYPEWQVDLSKWKLEHGYHRLTQRRAASFATSPYCRKCT